MAEFDRAKWILYSKTLALNVLAVLADIVSGQAGLELSGDVKVILLAVLNILNRFVTKQAVFLLPRRRDA